MWDTVLSLSLKSWARKMWNQQNIVQQDDRYLRNTWQEQAVQLQGVSVKTHEFRMCQKYWRHEMRYDGENHLTYGLYRIIL